VTIRAVIFDLGHTIWDIGSTRDAVRAAYGAMRATLCERLQREDLPPAEAFQRAVADVLREAQQTYAADSGPLDQPPTHTWVDEGCRRLGVALDEELLREITPPLFATEVDCLVCPDETREAVRALASDGYILGCVTNTLADRRTIERMLRDHRLLDLMRSIVVSAEEGWRKPHPSLFQKALREVDVRPESAVFVGDAPWNDIGGAKAVGMRAVLTQQYVARPYDGFDPPPDAIIGHLRELPAVIERLDSLVSRL
jgi:HAD superfamily hydrolase (TIGR01662 family)